MKVWDVDPRDRTVINPEGRECPLDPMSGQPKVPGNAITVAPPETGEREAAIAVDGSWQLVPDWRGHTFWTEDGTRHEITSLGVEPPTGASSEPPPKPLTETADDKRRELHRAREDAFATGTEFTFPGDQVDHIQIRPEDKANLLAIAMEARDLKAAGETNPVIDFRAASNTTYQLTPDQAIDMTNAALAHVKAIYEKSWQLKDAVDAALEAGDREAIEAVTWS